MAQVPVSILIPIKNEAANLPRCLQAIAWADEVVVVDSQSTDGSPAIAEGHGARVVQFVFNGIWPKKKNWALENIPFRHDWVFILDADEVLPPGAEEELRTITTGTGNPISGYWINRRFMFMGRWLRHAYYPNWNLRLFRHRLGRYERLVQGATGRLRSEMDHYAFPSVDVFVEKHNRYSNWEARLALEDALGRGGSELQAGAVSWRRRLKAWSRHLPFRPTLRFLYVYLFQFGFLDGRPGYYFARLHGFYEFLAVAKTHELRRAARTATDQPRQSAE